MTPLLEKGLACSAKLVSTSSMHLHQPKQSQPSFSHQWAGLPTALLQQDVHLGWAGFRAVLYCVKVSNLENNKVKLLKW